MGIPGHGEGTRGTCAGAAPQILQNILGIAVIPFQLCAVCPPPEGSCSAAGLGMGEPRLPEAPCRGHFSRDAGRGKLSLRSSSGCQTASSRKTTPFGFLITQIKCHLPCILPKVMGKEQSKHAGKGETLLGFNFIVRD